MSFIAYLELWAAVRRLRVRRQQQDQKLTTPVVCLHPLTYRNVSYGVGIRFQRGGGGYSFERETTFCMLCGRVLMTRER